MNFNQPLFSPSDVQGKCSIQPSTLRDWRSRDFSKHIGTVGENGRWKYSAVDMVELAIANLATRSGIEGHLAFKAAKECAPVAFYFWGAPVTPTPPRFAVFWRRTPVDVVTPLDQMFDWDRTDSLEDLANVGGAASFIFDGRTFATNYQDLGQWLQAQLENEGGKK